MSSSLNVSKDNIETFSELLNILDENEFKSIICNLDDEIVYCNTNNFEIKPNEILEIKNIFNGEPSTGFFVNGKRYFLKNSDSYYINGSGVSEIGSIIIERTNNNKCFISFYDPVKKPVEEAHTIFLKIIQSYFKNNKHEEISNAYK